MQNQIQKSEYLVTLGQTEQGRIDGGYGGNDGGCIPTSGPKIPDILVNI